MISVADEVRTVTLVQTGPIPRNIDVDGFHCKVSYFRQAIECDICERVGHVAHVCPLRGCRFHCHQPGHLFRDCTSSGSVLRDFYRVSPGSNRSLRVYCLVSAVFVSCRVLVRF